MDLKYVLGQIQADGGNLFHGTAPFHVVVATTTLWHSDAEIAGPFHTSKKTSGQSTAPDDQRILTPASSISEVSVGSRFSRTPKSQSQTGRVSWEHQRSCISETHPGW